MNLKDKLVDPRYVGILALVFLLIGFADALFVTDASSIAEMTVWGKTSIIAFMVVLGWIAVFMMVFPLVNRLFGKHDNPTPPDSGTTDDGNKKLEDIPVKNKKG